MLSAVPVRASNTGSLKQIMQYVFRGLSYCPCELSLDLLLWETFRSKFSHYRAPHKRLREPLSVAIIKNVPHASGIGPVASIPPTTGVK